MPATTPGTPVRARKRFGQHFLVQPGIARRIVELAQLQPSSTVLEIGPGTGVLTRLLAGIAARVFAIEVDRDLAARLREELADQTHVIVDQADALTVDFESLLRPFAPAVVVANLPYNVATPLMLKLLATTGLFSHLVLMLQKEVAARLTATPSHKAYGSLSVAVQLAASVRLGLTVGAAAFSPRPKVDSAVVVLRPHDPPRASAAERQQIEHVVRTVFTQRRKQLANSLLGVTPQALDVLQQLDIDPRRRPETLSVEDFMRLAAAIGSPGDVAAARKMD